MYSKKFKQSQSTDMHVTEKSKHKVAMKTYVKKNESQDTNRTSEEKIESILGKARSRYVVELINKGDELTSEDMDIITQTQEHILEEQKEVVECEEVDNFICSLSKCYLPDCVVHSVTPDFTHYCRGKSDFYHPISKMNPRMKKGLDVYLKNPNCSYVEVYERHICVISFNGTSKVISE